MRLLRNKEFYVRCIIQLLNVILVALSIIMVCLFCYIDKLSVTAWGNTWPNYHPEFITLFIAIEILIFLLSTFCLWCLKFEYGKIISLSGVGITINMVIGLTSYWLYWQGFPIYCL